MEVVHRIFARNTLWRKAVKETLPWRIQVVALTDLSALLRRHSLGLQRDGQGITGHLQLREVHIGDLSANSKQLPGLRIGFAVHELPLHHNDPGWLWYR